MTWSNYLQGGYFKVTECDKILEKKLKIEELSLFYLTSWSPYFVGINICRWFCFHKWMYIWRLSRMRWYIKLYLYCGTASKKKQEPNYIWLMLVEFWEKYIKYIININTNKDSNITNTLFVCRHLRWGGYWYDQQWVAEDIVEVWVKKIIYNAW